jgi:hypothetical protein
MDLSAVTAGSPVADVMSCHFDSGSNDDEFAERVQEACPDEVTACTGSCATQLTSLLESDSDGSMDSNSTTAGSPLADVIACWKKEKMQQARDAIGDDNGSPGRICHW